MIVPDPYRAINRRTLTVQLTHRRALARDDAVVEHPFPRPYSANAAAIVLSLIGLPRAQ